MLGAPPSCTSVRHVKHDTLHALKVLTISSPAIRERMLREGRVQASLQHPNIVPVDDVLELDGSPALLMEYVEGPSLEAALQRYRLTLSDAELLFAGILAGVQTAHLAGLVHRDLKPANVLLAHTAEGFVPKVTDFGLAKLMVHEPGMAHTRAGISMGTPSYMAPEQIRDARSVDQRADVWSLGCLLYELTTRRRAFPGDEALAIYNAVVDADFEQPRRYVPALPDRVNQAILGCLRLEPDERIPDCETLAAVLSGEISWNPEAEIDLGPPILGPPARVASRPPSLPDIPPMPLAPMGHNEPTVKLPPPMELIGGLDAGGAMEPTELILDAEFNERVLQHQRLAPGAELGPPPLSHLRSPLVGTEDQAETVVTRFDGTLAPTDSLEDEGDGWWSWLGPILLFGLLTTGAVVGMVMVAGGVVGGVVFSNTADPERPTSVAPVPADPAPVPAPAPPPPSPKRTAPRPPAPVAPAPAPEVPSPAVPKPAPAPQTAPAAPAPAPIPEPTSAAAPAPDATPTVATPAPTAGAAATGQRSVRLLSFPFGADILLNGQPVGRTPLKLELPPGRYPVRMTSGEQEAWFVVHLEADGPTAWCYKFPDRSVYIDSCPP